MNTLILFIENSATIPNNQKHETKIKRKFSIMGLVNNTGITDENIDEVVSEWNKLGSQ
jgi:hypothetical protein